MKEIIKLSGIACQTCIYYKAAVCRRQSPTAALDSVFPLTVRTEPEYYCGEWVSKTDCCNFRDKVANTVVGS